MARDSSQKFLGEGWLGRAGSSTDEVLQMTHMLLRTIVRWLNYDIASPKRVLDDGVQVGSSTGERLTKAKTYQPKR